MAYNEREEKHESKSRLRLNLVLCYSSPNIQYSNIFKSLINKLNSTNNRMYNIHVNLQDKETPQVKSNSNQNIYMLKTAFKYKDIQNNRSTQNGHVVSPPDPIF